MDDLGQPASYLTLAAGTPVYSADGEGLGAVEHVLADPEVDIFEGFVLDRSVLPGGHRFVDGEQIDEIFERGVVLKLAAADAPGLPQPSENPATMEPTPDDVALEQGGELERKLKRAWDIISGKG